VLPGPSDTAYPYIISTDANKCLKVLLCGKRLFIFLSAGVETGLLETAPGIPANPRDDGMILYRYILREYFIPFLYSLAVLFFLFVMEYAVELLQRQLLSKGLELSVILEIFAINLAWMVALTIPMAVLVATIMAYGKLSEDNEIVAIKASGRNLFYLLTPVFITAAITAVLVIFFNNLILPDANHRAANLLSDISRKKPAVLIEPGILIRDFPNYALYVEKVNAKEGKLWGIKIFSDQPGEDPTSTVAERGDLRVTRDGRYLQLTLYDGETHRLNSQNQKEYFIGNFNKQVLLIENVNNEFQRTESDYRGDREKSAAMMMAEVREARDEKEQILSEHARSIDSLLGTIAAFESLAVAFPAEAAAAPGMTPREGFLQWKKALPRTSTSPAVRKLERENSRTNRALQKAKLKDGKISQYMVEVHKKYSIPFACIVLVLIGAPLGIMARKGGIAMGAGYSFFFFLLYWIFLIGGEILADRQIISPVVAMWSANVIVGACGIFLIARMIRENPVLSFKPVQALVLNLAKRKSASHVAAAPARSAGALRAIRNTPFFLLCKTIGILPAYLMRIFLFNLVGLLVALLFIFIVVDYIGNLRTFQNARWSDIGLYYLNFLPWLAQTVLPIVGLLAGMLSIGYFAKNSELTASKAAGVSIGNLSLPLLALGLILSAASFYLSETILPRANERRTEIRERIMEGGSQKTSPAAYIPKEFRRNFYYFANNEAVYCFGEFRTVPQSTKNVWREIIRDHSIKERTWAQRLLYSDSSWHFVNGHTRVFYPDSSVIRSFDTLADTILTAPPADMIARIKRPEEMGYWELQGYIDKARRRGEKVFMYIADLHFKISYPFMNFIVILLAVAITARAGRRGSAVLFGIGLLLCFCYWFISQFSLAFAKNGDIPPLLGAWLGNLLFFLSGCVLYRKALR
jgi:lipopolysaccharide export system permease protein